MPNATDKVNDVTRLGRMTRGDHHYFLCHQLDLEGGIFFTVVHYILYLCFIALFCMCVVFANKKVKEFNVLPTGSF